MDNTSSFAPAIPIVSQRIITPILFFLYLFLIKPPFKEQFQAPIRCQALPPSKNFFKPPSQKNIFTANFFLSFSERKLAVFKYFYTSCVNFYTHSFLNKVLIK